MNLFSIFFLSFFSFAFAWGNESNLKIYQEFNDFYYLKNYNSSSSAILSRLSHKIKDQPELAHYQSLVQKALVLSKSNAKKPEDCLNILNEGTDKVYQLVANRVYQICLSAVPKTSVEQEVKGVDNKKYMRDKFFDFYEKASVQIKEHKYTSAFYWSEQAFEIAKKINEERPYVRMQFLGKDFLRYRRFDYAIKIFKMLLDVEQYSEKEELHKLILISHNAGANYKRALRHIEKSNLLNEKTPLGSGLLFWIGKTQLKANKKTEAEATFKRLISDHPISFYSTLVINEYFEKPFFEGRFPASIPSDFQMEKLDTLASKHSLLRLEGFVASRNYKFSEVEAEETYIQHEAIYQEIQSKSDISKIDKSQFDFLVLQRSLAILEKLDSKLTSFKIIYEFLDKHPHFLHKEIFAHLFPTPYVDVLKKIDTDIDKNLVLALMRQESAFNTNALSTAGAMGLMQLMPFTAKRMNKKINKSDLAIPYENISVGSKYLDFLLSMLGKNPVYALSSYNAGENRVKEWIKEYLHKSDPLTALELIPYKETRMYVKLIYRNYFFYRDLDLGSKSKVDFRFNVI